LLLAPAAKQHNNYNVPSRLSRTEKAAITRCLLSVAHGKQSACVCPPLFRTNGNLFYILTAKQHNNNILAL
jgi:hypothetical protein